MGNIYRSGLFVQTFGVYKHSGSTNIADLTDVVVPRTYFQSRATRQRRHKLVRDFARRAITIPRILRQTSLHNSIESPNLNRLTWQMIIVVQHARQNLVLSLAVKWTRAYKRLHQHHADSKDVRAFINRTSSENLRSD